MAWPCLSILLASALLLSENSFAFTNIELPASTPAKSQASPKTVKVKKTQVKQIRRRTLTCPSVPLKRGVSLPSPPYDLERGDCALQGKGEEIEAYLTELERIANSCRDRRDAAWQVVQDARPQIDRDIDALPPPPPPPPPPSSSSSSIGSRQSLNLEFLELASEIDRIPPSPRFCSVLLRSGGPGETIDFRISEEGFRFTRLLEWIGEDVAKYCRMIDELSKPLAQLCEDTEDEATCMIEDPVQGGVSDAMRASFHQRIESTMNGIVVTNESLDAFYSETLSQSGWGNFRQYFSADTLPACPASEQRNFLAPTSSTLQRSSQKLLQPATSSKSLKKTPKKKSSRATIKKSRGKKTRSK